MFINIKNSGNLNIVFLISITKTRNYDLTVFHISLLFLRLFIVSLIYTANTMASKFSTVFWIDQINREVQRVTKVNIICTEQYFQSNFRFQTVLMYTSYTRLRKFYVHWAWFFTHWYDHVPSIYASRFTYLNFQDSCLVKFWKMFQEFA